MMRHSRVWFDSILILGCGYTGTVLAELAQQQGLQVTATRRKWPHPMPFQTLDLDVTQTPDLSPWIRPTTAIVWSVPTLPELEDHTAPLRHALNAAATANAPFVYISSTSVFGQHHGQAVLDESECHPDSPAAIMRRDSEALVLAYPRGIVARPAGIYGPGRDLARAIESGRYQVVDPSKRTNRIHVRDLARAILFLLEHEQAYQHPFNVADGNPATVGEVVDLLVTQYGIPRPPTTSLEAYRATHGEDAAARWTNLHLVLPNGLKNLGFEFDYPDILEAYRTGGIR